jgi:hypothetical protein
MSGETEELGLLSFGGRICGKLIGEGMRVMCARIRA